MEEKMSRYIFLLILLGGLISSCASLHSSEPVNTRETAASKTIIFIKSTDDRTKSPDTYFSTEYRRINERRRNFGFESSEENQRPPMLVGLAVSGGGIRSNAFQMGLFSGLYSESFGKAKLLDRIDYISSVSGGSWANAALWAWPDGLEGMFQCLDKAAAMGKKKALEENPSCADAAKMLRAQQDPELISRPDHQRKEEWEKDIQMAHLGRGCNVYFDKALAKECTGNLVTKPYFIINSTHSARSENPGVDGYPFETTPDGTGTVVDDGSKIPLLGAAPPKDLRAGFFIKFGDPDAKWDRRTFFALHIPGGKTGLENGSRLSLIAAHSSAVIKGKILPAAFLTFYFQVSENGEPTKDKRLREEYKVTDGGKSDNTGMVALIDRGVDMLVASYMGKEEKPFEDLSVVRGQAKKLFSCELSDVNEAPNHPRSQVSYYSCATSPSKAQKPVLNLHPWPENINDFSNYLEARANSGDTGAKEILNYLKDEQNTVKEKADRFPQTPTFKTEYDERLIRAYYLLGKFTAQKDIAPLLRNRITIK
jgi:hypothetical protein